MPPAIDPTRVTHGEYHGEYPAPKKYALVISCVDARLLDDTVRFLNHDNLTNRYYHVTVPGAALCFCDATDQAKLKCDPHTHPPLTIGAWRTALTEQLLLALKLTKFGLSDVYIIQHRDCGAYKVYFEDHHADPGVPDPVADAAELDDHTRHARELCKTLADLFAAEDGPVHRLADAMNKEHECHKKHKCPNDPVYVVKTPKVRAFMMDMRGNVDVIVPADGDPV